MSSPAIPLNIEIVAFAPTAFYHCTHCEVVWRESGFSEGVHEEQLKSSLPPDLVADYQAVSNWVHYLLDQYCDQIIIKVVDATSVEGFWKSVRHGLGRYPAVIVNGRSYPGTNFSAAEAAIAGQLARLPA